MIRIPTHRKPTHPGEMLTEEFLVPMGISQQELATAIHLPEQYLNKMLNAQQSMTPSTALRLAKYFGMSASFWMTLQLRWDLYHAQQTELKALAEISPRQTA